MSVGKALRVAVAAGGSNYLQRAPSPSGLADVIDLILDKGLVIDVYLRVAVIGIELVTVDARIVVASVDTYLRFAEAVNRLDLTETEMAGLPELTKSVSKKAAEEKVQGAIEAPKEHVKETARAGKEKAASGFERVKEKIPGR